MFFFSVLHGQTKLAFKGLFSQGPGDFFRDGLNFDFFHALIVAVRALLFVARGTAQI
jgi:hypothetical protein